MRYNPTVVTNRRAFLVRSATAALASGAGFGLLSAIGCSGSAGIEPAASGLPWGALAHRLSGRLVLPNDAGYAELARPNNLRYASRVPAGIAMCTNAADVSASILWCARTAFHSSREPAAIRTRATRRRPA